MLLENTPLMGVLHKSIFLVGLLVAGQHGPCALPERLRARAESTACRGPFCEYGSREVVLWLFAKHAQIDGWVDVDWLSVPSV